MSVQKIEKYICGNVQFDVSATDDIHHKLQTDDQFASQYFENLIQQHNTPETADDETDQVANNLISGANESEEAKFWTPTKIKLLLDEYKKRIKQFRDPGIKKNRLYREIAAEFLKHNINIPYSELDKKIRNMKSQYKKKLKSKRSTGQGRAERPWLQMMTEIFHNDESVILTDNVIESSTSQINPLPLNLSKSNKRFENIFSDADTIDSTSSHSLAADENIEKQVKKDAGKNIHARQLYGQRNKQLQLDIEKKEIFKQMAKNSEDNNNILSNNAYIWKNTMDNLITVLKEKNEIMKERNDIFSDISNKLDGPGCS
ncbi:unnamed protein product [Parnassius apollo]|uniref:(apollo) hypothetical protein n=1 Tax=Parnassius apollo TaxID=110799 RepID=A0A8S3XR34_PARAO|nr:unnamed protein product [Parnassius apollo]